MFDFYNLKSTVLFIISFWFQICFQNLNRAKTMDFALSGWNSRRKTPSFQQNKCIIHRMCMSELRCFKDRERIRARKSYHVMYRNFSARSVHHFRRTWNRLNIIINNYYQLMLLTSYWDEFHWKSSQYWNCLILRSICKYLF